MGPSWKSVATGARSIGRTYLRALDALLFPPRCGCCDTWETTGPFCRSCLGQMLDAAGPACPSCAMPLGTLAADRSAEQGGCGECRGRRLGFDGAVALGPYQGPIRHCCLRIKRVGHAWMARQVGLLLADARADPLRAFVDSADRPPVVVAVPLHWWKRWQRQYNQSDEIASALAGRLRLRRLDPIARGRATGTLAGKGRVERAREMRRAFRVRRGARLDGRDVILVDDILTTGATCGAAARALKRAGAGRVLAVVVGRAEGRT